MKTFNNLAEMQPYYNKETNTYAFEENGIYFDVCFAFDLRIDSNIYALDINAENINAWNINAWNINACNINAWDINALDINALDINAWDISAQNIDAMDINARDIHAQDISFYAVCFAYETFICKSVVGKRENAKYFCLDSEVKIKEVKE